MAQNSSRLHRLLTLLDTGSTQETRSAAARQIGDIAKSHPQDLNSLLKKVSQYLRSRNWDTRVAAAHAVGAIAENVKHTSLKDLSASLEAEIVDTEFYDVAKDIESAWSKFDPNIAEGLTFRSFEINKVLDFGSPLLASGGQEYDVASDSSKSPAERLARQKQNLRRRLGLDVCEQFMDVNDVIKDEDLLAQKGHWGVNGQNNGFYASQSAQNIQQLVSTMVSTFRPKRLSARELNLLKRKAKVNAKDHTKSLLEDDELEVQNSTVPNDQVGTNKYLADAIADEGNSEYDDNGRWPFRQFVEQLIHDMFDSVWEVRHGAIMALREILTHQGACAGVYFPSQGSERPCSVDLEDKNYSLKRSREIDLNKQFATEEIERETKRHKSIDEPNTFESGDNYLDKDLANGAYSNTEAILTGAISPFPNGDSDIDHVKVEPDLCTDGSYPPCKIEDTSVNAFSEQCSSISRPTDDSKPPCKIEDTSVKAFSEQCGSISRPTDDSKPLCKIEDTSVKAFSEQCSSISRLNFLANLSQNSNLMKLIKLGRVSSFKNWEFLQDCAIRFLCVLSLDRFGDYVSDQVVAPVRETCAQALGVLLKYMHPSLVRETLNVLLQMQCRQEWEVRHGSLLGIKYLVAVRPEMLQDLLIYILPACKAGLEDPDDDVRAVAAEALIPAAATIVSLNDQLLHPIVMLLWDILLDLDDLSPSTSSVMNLLAELYSQTEMVPKMLDTWTLVEKQEFDLNKISQVDEQEDNTKSKENPYILATLIPRLWPFMRHSITSVRHSAICTLERLLEVCYARSSAETVASKFWPTSIVGDALRIVFQNLLLESNDQILQCSERVWRLLLQCPEQELESSARSYFSNWMQLATTPYGSSLDSTKMFWPVALPRRSRYRAAAKMRAVKLEHDSDRVFSFDSAKENASSEQILDASTIVGKIIVGADSDKSVTHTRVITATALGVLASKLAESSWQVVIDPLWIDLISFSGVQRQVASMVLIAWFKELKKKDPAIAQALLVFCASVKQWLLDLLACADFAFPTKDSVLPYAELSRTYTKMRNEAKILYNSVDSCGLLKDHAPGFNYNMDSLSVDEAITFTSRLPLPGELDAASNIGKHLFDDLESAKQRLLSTSGYLKCVQNNLHITVSSLVAATVVWMSELPSRLNPVILPLMAAVKREQEEMLQQKAAEALAELIFNCLGRKPGPNDKLIKNLCSLTCTDSSETPQAAVINSMEVIEEKNLLSFGKLSSSHKTKVQVLSVGEDRSKVEGYISRRGSEMTLKHLCKKFGSSLFSELPKLWDSLIEVLKPVVAVGQVLTHGQQILQLSRMYEDKDPQALINNIQVVRSIAPLVDESLRHQLLTLLPCLLGCVRHSHVAVRLAASRCITSMAKSMTGTVMGVVIENAIPMLSDSSSVNARQGAGMLVSLLVQGLDVELVPYAPLLVVPLLRCMSDCDHAVRQSVTHSFAALVPLLPLARGVPMPDELSKHLFRNTEDAQFLEQLLDNSHIDDYKLCIDLKVVLRRYQQEGINWLAFLRRFKLHGILCDDMGLGKTLQASAIVATDIAERRSNGADKDPQSLIICPSTLVGHWAYEIEKYIDSSVMTTLQYVGSAQERMLLRNQFDMCNVIVTSYDIVRKDIDYLGKLSWNYCILDEGHIIKNSKSKITCAAKQLKAEHRLILSGTPIQNNVLELWSLFDFLMPGFLGTERQFQAAYGKPLQAAKDSKCSARDAEAGALAMEALHKQVMPFLLRRTKDEVLSDLPEKIIQDRYCDLSPLQLKLYEQFSYSDAKEKISTLVKEHEVAEESNSAPKATRHVFQALQYILKLCSHPLLVLGDKPPDSLQNLLSEIVPGCTDYLRELHELHHSPKLVALQEILQECGIGFDNSSSEGVVAVGQHRVLIFAQHKAFLDVIERDLFQSKMKSVTYLRLDGSVEPEKRFEIVKAFNSDPTIDALLLTTHVGGLGLNLTSADTLVFMEHDWNPMRDLQAMDRAHRLGQRKVVNVHRLIMRGSLEEKVMSLQKFKVSVANSVINADNASLKTMNTDQLLDLFTSMPTTGKSAALSSSGNSNLDKDPKSMVGGKGLKAILSGLEELWDQSQYADEYNLSHFLAKLNG